MPEFNTVAELLSDTTLGYSGSPVIVAAGDSVLAQGFRYEVAPSNASDQHLTTAGGVNLYALPDASGELNVVQFGAVGNNVTDDWPAFNTALLVNRGHRFTYGYTVVVPEPSVAYRLSQELNFKRIVHLRGTTGSGRGTSPCRLLFDANVRGIIVNRSNTFSDGTAESGSGQADDSIISGLTISSQGGTNRNAHGVWFRARGVIQDCRITGFSGNGLNIVATASTSDPARIGNSNCWKAYNIRVDNCGQWGMFLDGADVNAGTGIGIDCAQNQGGIYDSSFLGNFYFGCHTNANGRARSFGGNFAWFDGITYYAVPLSTPQQLVDTQPGTSTARWAFWRDHPERPENVPEWVPGLPEGTFEFSAPYVSDNLNARNVWFGCYSEGNQVPSYFVYPDVYSGGHHSAGVRGSALGLSGRRLIGAIGVETQSADIAAGVTGVGYLLNFLNTGSLGANRGVGMTFGVDGANPFPLARIHARAGSSSRTSQGQVRLEVWNGATESYRDMLWVQGASSSINPGVDNTNSLGTAALRWSEIFAASSTINTSDEREKQQIGDVPDEWLDAWSDIQWSRFKWNQAVEEKGDDARWHVGLVAQQIRDAFAAHGLDACRIGLLCYDAWDEEREPIIETVQTGADDEGNPIFEEVDTGETEVVIAAGSRWGVRYDQAEAMEAAWQRRELRRLREMLAAKN